MCLSNRTIQKISKFCKWKSVADLRSLERGNCFIYIIIQKIKKIKNKEYQNKLCTPLKFQVVWTKYDLCQYEILLHNLYGKINCLLKPHWTNRKTEENTQNILSKYRIL